MLKTMKKSLTIVLAIVLCVGMLCVPASATCDSIPYFFNDYEDNFIGVYHGDMTRVAIAEGGAGSSAKCLKITDNTASYEDRVLVTRNGNAVRGAVTGGSIIKISFYIKITQALSKGDVMFLVSTDNGAIYPIASFDKTNTTDWQKVTAIGTLPAAATTITAVNFRFGSHGTSTDLVEGDTTGLARDFYLDDLTINFSKADQISNFDNYYAGFEGTVAPVGIYDAGYRNATTTERVVGNKTLQIVSNPAGKGQVVKYTMGANLSAVSTDLMFSNNTSTDQYAAMYAPAGTIPVGSTATIRFKYYLGTEMSADNTPGFAVSLNNHAIVLEGPACATTANEWHVATVSYTNNTEADIALGNSIWVRASRSYHGAGSTDYDWIAANKADGETYGARTFYFDDLEMFITAADESVPAVEIAPKSSDLVVTGDVKVGNQITFAHTFTAASTSDAGVTDASIIRLMNVTASGEVASIATADISGTMTVPAIPADSASMYFEVVPIGSDGTVGDVATYAVTVEPEEPELPAVTTLTQNGDGVTVTAAEELINAYIIFVSYDTNGKMVDYDYAYVNLLAGQTGDFEPLEGEFTTGDKTVAMLWGDLEDCKPLAVAINY